MVYIKGVSRRSGHRAQMGFTLIEVMITVVIIGILAAIAYPSYVNYITRSYRDSAKACLSEYVLFMERYYTANLTYEDAAPVLGCSTEADMENRYTFGVSNLAQGTYTVTATVKGVQASNDTKCGNLSINHQDVRTASDAACW